MDAKNVDRWAYERKYGAEWPQVPSQGILPVLFWEKGINLGDCRTHQKKKRWKRRRNSEGGKSSGGRKFKFEIKLQSCRPVMFIII